MKKNKIILLSYSGLLILFLLSFPVMGLLGKNITTKTECVLKEKSYTLNTFSHINISDDCKVIIEKGDNGLTFLNDTLKPSVLPQYEIKNDTLFIASSKNNNNSWITIKAKEIHTITCNNGNITLKDLNLNTLTVKANNTRIGVQRNIQVSYAEFYLENNAEFRGNNYIGDSVKVNLNSSTFRIYNSGKLNVLEGKVYNNSSAQIPQINKLNIERDNSSEVKMY